MFITVFIFQFSESVTYRFVYQYLSETFIFQIVDDRAISYGQFGYLVIFVVIPEICSSGI